MQQHWLATAMQQQLLLTDMQNPLLTDADQGTAQAGAT